jgi:hypothetical protein
MWQGVMTPQWARSCEYLATPYTDWTKSEMRRGPHHTRGNINLNLCTEMLAKYPMADIVDTISRENPRNP